MGDQRSITTDSIGFVIMLFFIYGMMGIYGCQVKESGGTGFLGFLLPILSNCTLIRKNWSTETDDLASLISALDMPGGFAGLIGYTLLGAGSLKAGILPEWAVWLWITGYALSFFMMLLFVMGVEIVYGISRFGVVIGGIGRIGAGINLLSLPDNSASPEVSN